MKRIEEEEETNPLRKTSVFKTQKNVPEDITAR